MKVFVIVILLAAISYSQETIQQDRLNSLYNEIVSLHQGNTTQLESQTPIKCGFGLYSQVRTELNNFSASQRAVLQKILQRPDLQMSVVSPSGHFRIHFDTTGTNSPHYIYKIDTTFVMGLPKIDTLFLNVQQSVDSVAAAIDSAYNFEVNYLGYPPAPPDYGQGGDDKYDIYIKNLGGSEYGYTEPDELISASDTTYTAFMVIDNAYSPSYNYGTTGLNGAKVTVAHEYHHGIQIGNYIYRYDLDAFFYELTSVSMETFVYHSIPDYYNYLQYYFNSPMFAFGCIDCDQGLAEYALAIWNIFMQKQFGYDIIKKQWEKMPSMRAMYAINAGLEEYGSNFKKAFTKFSSWLYFTNYRAIPGKYFPAAADYPIIKPYTTITFNSSGKTVALGAYPTSQNFIDFVNPGNNDTLAVFIINSDLRAGVNNLSSTTSMEYNLYNSASSGSNMLTDQYYSKLSTANLNNWGETDILNGEVIRIDTTSQVTASSVDYVYPNPYSYNKNKNDEIEIPVKGNLSDKPLVYLYIYSISMHLVFSKDQLEATTGDAGNLVVKWNGRRSDNSKLASGVYIYFTKDGSNTTSGKIVIFND